MGGSALRTFIFIAADRQKEPIPAYAIQDDVGVGHMVGVVA
jgi:hypothetical protein